MYETLWYLKGFPGSLINDRSKVEIRREQDEVERVTGKKIFLMNSIHPTSTMYEEF
jgi:hypothetical protein